MMEHIHQRDWCSTRQYNDSFVDERDIDNCVIERILKNKFWDPLISSDEDEPVGTIDWDSIFVKKDAKLSQFNVFIPGYRLTPHHPKISALTKEEHRQCVKVLCAKYNQILPKVFLGRPIKGDRDVFEEKKEIYSTEQKEYIEWAKNLWITTNCIRALRPKPSIETVYEAEFKMRAHALQCFPKTYTLAAQIPLRAENHRCEIILPKQDMVQVNISDLPEVSYPRFYDGKVSVLRACAVPEPCAQHPCKFKLPNESGVSLLPLTEIHKELAQYALDNAANYIASESAMKCLLEVDRAWTIPLSVCEVIAADGERNNIVVLGSDFPKKKDPAPTRSYKAFKHLLLEAFTSKSTRPRTISESIDNTKSSKQYMNLRSRNNSETSSTDVPLNRRSTRNSEQSAKGTDRKCNSTSTSDSHKAGASYTHTLRKIIDRTEASDQSDDDVDRLQIDLDDDTQKPEVFKFSGDNDKTEAGNTSDGRRSSTDHDASPPRKIMKAQPRDSVEQESEINLFSCVCKDSEFEVPPARSFKNWQIKNYTTKEQVNVIIHNSHKLRDERNNEVIVEPILEYQLDIGGTLQSQYKLQSLAFSLMLRKNAYLINARIDGIGGELVTVDTLSLKEFTTNHGDFRLDTANIIYTTLNQLAGLLPGAYLLRHEPSHGSNAILYSSRATRGADTLTLDWEDVQMSPAEEAKLVQTPPNLGPVLLPIHKQRRQLPLAFTYDARFVAKEPPKPVTKLKTPPAAIQWPKRNRGRKGKKK